MGYRKVYLTIEEEQDIERIKASREKEGRPNAAYNAILKEGLATVVAQELAQGHRAKASKVVGTTETVSATNDHSHETARRRRRRAT